MPSPLSKARIVGVRITSQARQHQQAHATTLAPVTHMRIAALQVCSATSPWAKLQLERKAENPALVARLQLLPRPRPLRPLLLPRVVQLSRLVPNPLYGLCLAFPLRLSLLHLLLAVQHRYCSLLPLFLGLQLQGLRQPFLLLHLF